MICSRGCQAAVWARVGPRGPVRPTWVETVLSKKLGLSATSAVPIMATEDVSQQFQGGIRMAKGRPGGRSGKGGMTSKAASRIQSAAARSGGAKVSKGSFAARAQSVAAKKGR